MKDVTQEQRWAQWLAQAENFAKKDHYVDALYRARRVRKEVQRALEAARDDGDAKRRERLERTLYRVDKTIERIQSQRDAWQSRIAEARQKRMENAAEEFKKPLPLAT